jgi:hypothetical protein
VRTATRRAVVQTAARLAALDRVRVLPFRFPEAGSVCLEMRNRAGALIGIGTKRLRRPGTAGVRIRWTGRKLPARVTLTASFAPARAGAAAQQSATRLGLRAAALRR